MKKLLVLAAAALSLGVLAGCNSKGSSESSSSSAEPVKSDWTSEEKALMEAKLGGNVIPFMYVEGMTLTDSYYEDYECLTVEAPAATLETLKAYETILVAKMFDAVVAVGSDSSAAYYGEYSKDCADDYVFKIQFYTKDGTAEGALSIDAYYLSDYSEYSLETWTAARSAASDYFVASGEAAPALPEALTTSATSFDFVDYRYVYYSYYGADPGFPIALFYLNEAKESELTAVQDAFVAIGYAATEGTDSSGKTYTYYTDGTSYVTIEYDEADTDNGYPEDISILVYNL